MWKCGNLKMEEEIISKLENLSIRELKNLEMWKCGNLKMEEEIISK